MKPLPCPRLFEAEAMRDGRLGGTERASFERHAAGCPICLREVEALEGLAKAVRASAQDHGDELHVQRERTRLVAAFDRALVVPERRWGARRRLWWPAVVLAVVAGCFVLLRGRPAGPPGGAANAIVQGESNAAWSVRTEGNREEITLERGSLWIHVDHKAQGSSSGTSRLRLVLPDGELEDTGTTFTVSADHGRTTRVAVQDGSVVLRVRGQAPVTINAGGIWTPDARPAVPAGPSAAPSPIEPPASAAPRPRPTRSQGRPDPSVDFRTAMATLAAGENREAAAAFTSFLVRHPQDPRAEDAAYLRVIALQRCAATDEMKAAAQDYLQRYPAGFRRLEVETLSQ